MEQYILVTWLAIVALVLLAHHLRRAKKLNFPPGPKPLPIIGSFILMSSQPHISIHELSKKYGEIMHFKFGSKNIVVGSSVEMAKVFLKTMDANFACRNKSAAGKYTVYNYSGITVSPYGPYLKQARKMCTMELFNAKRLEFYKDIRVEEIKSLVKTVHKLSGEKIALKYHLKTLSLNVVSRMVLGKKILNKSEDGGDDFREMLDEMAFLTAVPNIGDWIPRIGFLDLQGYVKRMKVVSKKFDRFFEQVLNKHNARRKAEGENFVPSDMVDVLLQHADDPTLDVKLERRGVKAISQDLLVGGVEGPALTVELAISQLLKNPKILEKAIDELDRVVGRNKWVEEKDMSNLPYIMAIAKEIMRFQPVVPILGPKRTREDCKVAGYDIPKDTIVMVNMWTIGRDPHLWDKPEEFYPERFIGKDIDVKGNHYELLPFGTGRRICLGCNLGLKLIELSLTNLLHGFTWKFPSKNTREDAQKEEISESLSTDTLVTIAHPRLEPEMYFL